jgi:hypothetical protein
VKIEEARTILESISSGEYDTPIVKLPHALSVPTKRSWKLGLMHCNNSRRSWVLASLRGMYQLTGNRDLEKRWGSANRDEPGYLLEIKSI